MSPDTPRFVLEVLSWVYLQLWIIVVKKRYYDAQ